MFQEPIIFKGNTIQKTAPIAIQTPMPELSHHTCFCSKHSKRIRDFLKSLEEKTNQSQGLTIDFATTELEKSLKLKRVDTYDVHTKVAPCWPKHLYSTVPDWYFPFSF